MRFISFLLILGLVCLCIHDIESATTKTPTTTKKTTTQPKTTTKPKTTSRVTTKTTKRTTTTKPDTFCDNGWTSYHLKEVLSSNDTMFHYEDAAVWKNGSFYLARFSIDETGKKNGFAIDFFDEKGSKRFTTVTPVDFNGTESGFIRIVLDAKGYLYLFLTAAKYELRVSHLMKLSPHGDVLKSINNNQMFEAFMSYSKYDDLLYLKFPDRLVAIETGELGVVMHRLLYFPLYSSQFIPVSKDKLYAFDGISLLKYDLMKDELVIKRLKDSLNYQLSFTSVVLNDCILVGLSTEYSGFNPVGNTSFNVILLENGMIETPFVDFTINNPAFIIKATEDNIIYLFDGLTNSVYILDYVRN